MRSSWQSESLGSVNKTEQIYDAVKQKQSCQTYVALLDVPTEERKDLVSVFIEFHLELRKLKRKGDGYG